MINKPLSTRELELLIAFKRTGDCVMAKISADLEKKAGISAVEFNLLGKIETMGSTPVRQKTLADSIHWEKSRLSHLLTRMERRGLVARKAQGARNTTVSISTAGRRTLRSARPVHAESVRKNLLGFMTDGEAEVILRVFSQISGTRPAVVDIST